MVSYTVLYYHYAFHLQMLLQIFKRFKGNVSVHSSLCFRFQCLLYFALQPNPLSHSMHLVQTLWNSQCHSFWHLLHQTAILCKSKSLSVLNFVSQSSHLTQFWRSPLKMKYARNFAQRFSLWYLKILPFSKSCSQLSHLTIKDLKNNSIILQVSGSNTLVLLPCNLAAYWFKVDCYSRLIFSVVKFGAGPLYALRANKLVLVSFIAETTQWLPVTLGQAQPLIHLSFLLFGVVSLVCNFSAQIRF